MAFKYFDYSPYNYVVNNPIKLIDPDGRYIRGIDEDDAEDAKDDIMGMFTGKRFKKFRNLIGLDKSGKQLKSMSEADLKKALDGVNLSDEEKALMSSVVNGINSSDEHLVEYVQMGEFISNQGTQYLMPGLKEKNGEGPMGEILKQNDGKLPAFIIGGGQTTATEKGSYSVIMSGLKAYGGNDYFNNDTKAYVTNPAGRVSITGHEVLGHGVLASLKRIDATSQHVQTIRFENLILRVMGFGNIQRDGTDHSDRSKVSDPSKLPDF